MLPGLHVVAVNLACAAQGLLRVVVQAKDILRDLAARLARSLPGVRAPSDKPCRMHIKVCLFRLPGALTSYHHGNQRSVWRRLLVCKSFCGSAAQALQAQHVGLTKREVEAASRLNCQPLIPKSCPSWHSRRNTKSLQRRKRRRLTAWETPTLDPNNLPCLPLQAQYVEFAKEEVEAASTGELASGDLAGAQPGGGAPPDDAKAQALDALQARPAVTSLHTQDPTLWYDSMRNPSCCGH